MLNIPHFLKHSSIAVISSLLIASPVKSAEVLGSVGLEGLKFLQDAQQVKQDNFYSSLILEPEFFAALNNNTEFKTKLFYRQDSQSESRSHGDIRELMFYRYADDWEFNIGIGKVFWGVTESRHLVDVINQIDNIESLDDEQRLGQPMLHYKLIRDWGTLDLFALPFFRELEFGESDLRPNLGLEVGNAEYQDTAKQRHLDIAARWSHSVEDIDFAISYFNGTHRTPLLNPVIEDQQLILQPLYVQTQQLGIEAQLIYQDWLLKFEGLRRSSFELENNNKLQSKASNAMVAGFEYTLYGINDSAHDIGLISEYLFDEWSQQTPFQKDWFNGVRWVWNDVRGTEILLGQIVDLDDATQIWQLEASRRLNESFKASMLARWAHNVDEENTFFAVLNQQDQLSLKVEYFY